MRRTTGYELIVENDVLGEGLPTRVAKVTGVLGTAFEVSVMSNDGWTRVWGDDSQAEAEAVARFLSTVNAEHLEALATLNRAYA